MNNRQEFNFMRLVLTLVVAYLINVQGFASQLVVGTLPFAPPFEMDMGKNNSFMGFDIELMNEICKRLHTTCKFLPLELKDIFTGINSRQFDLAIAAISITDERRRSYLFSLPYLIGNGHLMVNANSHLNSVKDLTGKHLGIEDRSLFDLIAKQYFKGATIVKFKNQQGLVQALADNTVDAGLLDEGAAEYWVNYDAGLYKLLGESIHVGDGYGIMSHRSNGELISRVNQAILSMEADGTYLKLYKRYWGLTTDPKSKLVRDLNTH